MKTQIKNITLCLGLLFMTVSVVYGQQSNNAKFRKPAYQTAAEKAARSISKRAQKTQLNKAFPSQFVVPGEFEESQSVAISWSFNYNNNGDVIGVDTTAPYGYISKQLCDAIQPECPVWIRINEPNDSNIIKAYMTHAGTPLYNYKFIVQLGDDWWTRDYGPMAFYYGKDDSIGFVDMKYYEGRDYDNAFPQQLADAMGYKNWETELNAEGGNLMADGFGTMFFSTMIGLQNADTFNHEPAWTNQQTLDTIKNVFNLSKMVNLPTLTCDGGTGHIDMYTKLLDEETILLGIYNPIITASDRKVIESNKLILQGLKSTYNRPYKVVLIDMPTDDAGKYSRKTCNQLDRDARTFVNGITVNKTFIYPSYYDGKTGNAAEHKIMKDYLQSIMPGYKMVPIDSRDLTPMGGAIHCIAMQIPVENPLRFWHPSLEKTQLLQPKYRIVSKITNRSGIDNAKCFWKKNDASTWNELSLTDSAGYFIGDIPNTNFALGDSVQYYLKATSKNGKVATKPITAPDGFYKVYFKATLAVNDVQDNQNANFDLYPNPAKQIVNIRYKSSEKENIKIVICDLSGKEVYNKTISASAGDNEESINLNGFIRGMYFCTIKSNDTLIGTKKLVVLE
jgi:agmatine/peptidylarginine deiminase